MRVKEILIYFIVLISPIFISAQVQKELVGLVYAEDGEKVTHIGIEVADTAIKTQTDKKGEFKINGLLTENTYNIQFYNKQGILLFEKEIFFDDKTREFVFIIPSNKIFLKGIQAKGKNGSEKNKESGFAMNIVDTEEATKQNLETTELLNRSAGIKIRQVAGMGSDVNFNLNGLSGNAVRIFIDGIPMRNYGRSFSLSNIPPAMVERVEVYKGVLPAELGEDALGGGINVILKKSRETSLFASYALGSFNTHQLSLNASYRNQKNGFTANVSSYLNYTDNDYKVWGDNVSVSNSTTGAVTSVTARRFHDSYYASAINAKVGFTRQKWADELLLGFMLSEMKKDIQTGATMKVVYGNRRTESKSGMANLQFSRRNLFIKGLDINTFTTFSRTFRTLIDDDPRLYDWSGKPKLNHLGEVIKSPLGGEAGVATRAENTEDNLSNRTNLHYHFNRNHKLDFNVFHQSFSRKIDDPYLAKIAREALDKRKYAKNVLGLNYEANFFGKKLKTNFFYKYYQQSIQLTEVVSKSNPQLGVYDVFTRNHDRSIGKGGYGLAISYQVLPKIAVLFSAEKAYRLPGATELLGNTSQQINPSYSLVPESGNNFNLGFTFGIFNLKNHQLFAEVNLFVRDINDLITRGVPRDTDDSFNFVNLGKIFSKGADAELKYNYQQKLFLNFNISYNQALFNLEKDPISGLRYAHYKKRLRNQPYFTSNTNVSYRFQDLIQKNAKLSIDYNFNYTHEFFRDWEGLGSVNKVTIPAQPLHDFGLVYTFPNHKWTLGLNARNIFNTQVFDNFALQKPGRAFFGKVTFTAF